MLYTTVFAVVAALSVSAAPIVDVPATKGSLTFSVSTVPKPNHVRNGKAALARAYAKYGITSTRHSKRQGTVVANPDVEDGGDLEYTCPVSIGGQTVNLDFDTGSADLWVFSSLQPASQRTGHSYYTPSKSTTAKVLSGATWDISYADGSGASGSVYKDTVKIGGTTVTGQAVELAKTVSSAFISSKNDGLVGLAFSSINTVTPTAQVTFFDNAKKQGLAKSLFAAYLKHEAVGSYDFGFVDTAKYTGALQYAAVDSSNGFWEVATSSFKIGSKVLTSDGTAGIADTGTTLLLVDDTTVDAYYAAVSGASYDSTQGGYTFPCTATLPSFSIKLGSYYATVPGKYINYGTAGSTTTCFGGIQSAGDVGFNIYGDIFFKSQYVVFDQSTGTNRLGFAPQK